MKIEEMKVGELIPYENNPRKNDAAVDAVAASIREFGFKVPIIVDKNNVIVAGHTRLRGAEKLGMKTVPVIRADDLTEEQIRAFRLADNKTGELAEWDFEKLEEELRALDDIDMGQFGFDSLEEKIHDYNVQEDDFDEDEVPKEEPKAKRGDIYQLGEHRLMCGDSTNPDDLKKLLGGGGKQTWSSRIRPTGSRSETRTPCSTASRRLDAAPRTSPETRSRRMHFIKCWWLRLRTSARTERRTAALTT